MTSLDRIFIAHVPAAGEMLFRSMTGQEGLSELFEFEVSLLSPTSAVDLNGLLGQSMSIEIREKPMTPRYLNGVIARMALAGREESGDRYYRYQATLRPALWYTTQNSDFRIFQEQTVPQILTTVLSGYQIKIDNRLSAGYRAWSYCVQYQESDFDFISRLMEHEGIYYYFTHQLGGHTLVLADAPLAHMPMPGYAEIAYRLSEAGLAENEGNIQRWKISDSITASLLSMDDYDFRKPRARLLSARPNPASFAQDKAQRFEWPGGYIEANEGMFYAGVRQQEQEARHELASGLASALGVAPGYTFMLLDAPRMADQRLYLTVQARYFFEENAYASKTGELAEHHIDFLAVPATVNWRPLRTTPWPKTHGPQTAEVVGPPGESIWTDQYGRVKLKFRWDRHSAGDDTSSCWVRVSSAWAGWKYGAVQIPRVGEEVVVDFINGDPDRPLITGRVYNQDNMPPWELPFEATKMGITSRTKDGNPATANFLSLEDAPGIELFNMHAERDMEISVENDKRELVTKNSTTFVGGDEKTHVVGSQELQVDRDQKNTIGISVTTEIGTSLATQIGTTMSTIVGTDKDTQVGSTMKTEVQDSMTTKVGTTMETTVGTAMATTVGTAMATTVGGAMVTTVGLGNITTVGLANITTVGGLMTTNVGAAMTTAVVGPYLVLSPFITIG